MNPIQEIIQGFGGGLTAGFTGYMIGILTTALFEAFTVINPLIPIFGLVFSFLTFFSGTSEAYLTGFFFSIGIITTGYFLSDFVTVFSGSISIIGLIIGWLKK